VAASRRTLGGAVDHSRICEEAVYRVLAEAIIALTKSVPLGIVLSALRVRRGALLSGFGSGDADCTLGAMAELWLIGAAASVRE